MGGLAGTDFAFDGDYAGLFVYDPIHSSLQPSGSSLLGLAAAVEVATEDFISLVAQSPLEPTLITSGNWRLVPEPATCVCGVVLVAFAACLGSRRHRRAKASNAAGG